MDVFVTIRKLIAEFVGATFNFSWPPSTNIIDGSEGFFRSLVYRKGSGEILIIHRFSPSFGQRFSPSCRYNSLASPAPPMTSHCGGRLTSQYGQVFDARLRSRSEVAFCPSLCL